jgi:benzoyl-CoA reductase subunit C
LTPLATFDGWFADRHGYARRWKERTGGKVAAAFCGYVPEEVLTAAGVLPVRVFGGHAPENLAEPHIFGMFCPFCRDVLGQGLLGRYDYADGLVHGQCCLHIRQAFQAWRGLEPDKFSHYLPMPHAVSSPAARPFARSEFSKFREAVETWTGVELTEARLAEALDAEAELRALLTRLYELRRAETPPVLGHEALRITVACRMVERREAADMLRALMDGLAKIPPAARAPGKRLLVAGSLGDEAEFLRLVESRGATVVVDDTCAGGRSFNLRAAEEGGVDALDRLASRYLNRPPCPMKDFYHSRLNRVMALAREWGVEGAILVQQKFCDPHEGDVPPLRAHLEAHGIPTLLLEFDTTLAAAQVATRVEAFLETLGMEDLF